MPARMIVDCRDDLKAVPFVERGGLEGERHQHDLRAAAAARLLLGSLKQLCTESAVPVRFIYPELAQFTGAAPRIPADPRHDAGALAHEEGEQFTVGNASRTRIELVDPIFEVLHFFWRRVN